MATKTDRKAHAAALVHDEVTFGGEAKGPETGAVLLGKFERGCAE